MTTKIIAIPARGEDLTSKIFYKALALAPVRMDAGRLGWLCACHCGNLFTRSAKELKNPYRISCGCIPRRASHGMPTSPEYHSWHAMIQRCTNPKAPNFHSYGERGITVHAPWREAFVSFYMDMGERPPGTSLDRIDNNGPYSPENCQWATPLEQSHNRRPASPHKDASRFAHNGLSMTIAQWAQHLGLDRSTVRRRLKAGWPLDRVLSEVKSR